MRDSRPLSIAAALVAVGGAALAFVAVTDFPPSIDKPFHRDVGQAIAREALRYLKPTGSLVVLVRDTSEFPHPEADALLEGFRGALGTSGREIDSVRSLQLDPLRPLAVPPGDFYELLRTTRAGGVIVSFMGPPELTPEQRAQLPPAKAEVVAFCPGNIPRRSNLRELLEAGLVQAAVVDRPGARARSKTFDEAYRVVRQADATSLEASETESR